MLKTLVRTHQQPKIQKFQYHPNPPQKEKKLGLLGAHLISAKNLYVYLYSLPFLAQANKFPHSQEGVLIQAKEWLQPLRWRTCNKEGSTFSLGAGGGLGIDVFYKNICVPIMFSHVLNGVSQVLHVFPIMFPIAQNFYPIGFAQSFPLFPYIGGPNTWEH